MAEITITDIEQLIDDQLPDNSSRIITELIMRTLMKEIANFHNTKLNNVIDAVPVAGNSLNKLYELITNLVISNIAGLQDALDEKFPYSGGNLTGDIQFGGSLAKFGTGVEIYGENQSLILQAVNSVVASLASGKNWQFRDTDLLTTAFGFQAMLKWVALSANRTATFPNKNITVAGLDDIDTAIANLVNSSPAALDTLVELAAALGNDPNFATTVMDAIGGKASLSGYTMAGDIDMVNYLLKVINIKSVTDEFILINNSNFAAKLKLAGITSNRNVVIQNKDHTVAGLDDIKAKYLIDTTLSSHTGTLSETVVKTKEIPAGTYQNGDFFSFMSINEVDTDTCHNRFYINSTPNLTTGSPQIILYYNQASSLNIKLFGDFFIQGGKLEGWKQGTTNSATVYGTVPGTAPSITIDFSTTQYFIQTAELAISTKLFKQKAIKLTRERE